jgi:hypothetical protein
MGQEAQHSLAWPVAGVAIEDASDRPQPPGMVSSGTMISP